MRRREVSAADQRAGGRRGSDRTGGRFGDRGGEQLRHAGIAPVVHVQFVRRDEGVERHVLNVVPVAHHREAVEQIDILFLGGDCNLIFHAGRLGLGQHPRRKLHVDQHHIGAGLA